MFSIPVTERLTHDRISPLLVAVDGNPRPGTGRGARWMRRGSVGEKGERAGGREKEGFQRRMRPIGTRLTVLCHPVGAQCIFFSFFHMADKVGPLWWDRMIVGEQEATLV